MNFTAPPIFSKNPIQSQPSNPVTVPIPSNTKPKTEKSVLGKQPAPSKSEPTKRVQKKQKLLTVATPKNNDFCKYFFLFKTNCRRTRRSADFV